MTETALKFEMKVACMKCVSIVETVDRHACRPNCICKIGQYNTNERIIIIVQTVLKNTLKRQDIKSVNAKILKNWVFRGHIFKTIVIDTLCLLIERA
jgi:hypothetical protein